MKNLILLFSFLSLLLFACTDEVETKDDQQSPEFTLTEKDNPSPNKNSQDTEPIFQWSNAPAGTKFFVIVGFDVTDGRPTQHYVNINIPSTKTDTTTKTANTFGTLSGNDVGKPNSYLFTIFAFGEEPTIGGVGTLENAFTNGKYTRKIQNLNLSTGDTLDLGNIGDPTRVPSPPVLGYAQYYIYCCTGTGP